MIQFLNRYNATTNKKGFTLIELMVVMAILGILAGMIGMISGSARQKGRDARRKADLNQMAKAMEFYFNDNASYPGDNGGSGQMYACGATGDSLCDWGEEFANPNGTVYMAELPKDPAGAQHYFFFVTADGLSYQLDTRVENENDSQINHNAQEQPLYYSDTDCGAGLCNYGVSSPGYRLDAGRTLAP